MSASSSLLALPGVTLICVDNRTPHLALQALRHCMAQVEFGEVVLFTRPELLEEVPAGIRIEPVHITSVPEYSEFVLRGLLPHVHTSHCLLVQWDGYVLDARQWRPEWLHLDYLGAPFKRRSGELCVGNGGFSLRSRRLLEALQDPALTLGHPEDVSICCDNRARLEQVHGIRFASVEEAQRFAFERVGSKEGTFGFHGLFNMHRVMAESALGALLHALPDNLAKGLDAHDLCRSLIAQGRLDQARLLLNKRLRLGMRDRRTWRLRWQLAWARMWGRGSGA